jgi:hypothetical protein
VNYYVFYHQLQLTDMTPPTVYEMVKNAWNDNLSGFRDDMHLLERRHLSEYNPVHSHLFYWPQTDRNWQYLYDAFATFMAEGLEAFERTHFNVIGRPAAYDYLDEFELGSDEEDTDERTNRMAEADRTMVIQSKVKHLQRQGGGSKKNFLIGDSFLGAEKSAKGRRLVNKTIIITNGQELKQYAMLAIAGYREDVLEDTIREAKYAANDAMEV